MPNYVDNITIENSYLDTQFELGYDWDTYNLYYQVYIPNQQGTYWEWEGGASNSTGKYFREGFLRNGHGEFNFNNLSSFNNFSESWREDEQQIASYRYSSFPGYTSLWYTATYGDKQKYYNNEGNLMSWGKLIIGDPNIEGPYQIGEIKLEVDGVLVLDLKPCVDYDGTPYFYDTVRNIRIYPSGYGPSSTAMIKTVVMTGDWQQLPIYDGIDKTKISNRIIEVNAYDDGYAAKYDEISISADEDNLEGVEISDYTVDKQTFEYGVADFIELKPRGTLVLPWNRQIAALNRPMVKGHRGDILRIVVR